METHYVVLCHKCAGLLTPANDTIQKAFGGCGCMSSYVRDWQKSLTIAEAKAEAVEHHTQSIKWLSQRQANGDDESIERTKQRIETINRL